MSFMDKAKDTLDDVTEKAGDLAKEHGDKIEGAIDKAKQLITDKTPDSVDGHVRKAAEKAKDLVEGLADKGDDDSAA